MRALIIGAALAAFSAILDSPVLLAVGLALIILQAAVDVAIPAIGLHRATGRDRERTISALLNTTLMSWPARQLLARHHP